ncbi:MAG: hypothetical protein LUH02_08205 [Erysipelotrichaceae bacterium]|nr:hypothetical protein [Erysipelotrichaceae bacterium]
MINEDMMQYMRMHPKWYLILSRYPEQMDRFMSQYRLDNHCSMNDYLSKIGTLIQMIDMLI